MTVTPFEIPVNPLEMALIRSRVGAFRFFE